MRKIVYALAVLLVVLGALVIAQGYESPEITVDQFSPSGGMVLKEQVRESLHNVGDAVDSIPAGFLTVDTNAVVEVTDHTPFMPGAMLYGTESNLLWVAVGTSTNDWKQITMEAE